MFRLQQAKTFAFHIFVKMETLKKQQNKYLLKDVTSMTKREHYETTETDPLNAFRDGLLSYEEFKGFCKGNIIKYIYRYEEKGGVEDLKKARDYINELISSFERKKS